jgi:hypothetical protein
VIGDLPAHIVDEYRFRAREGFQLLYDNLRFP